MREVRRETSYKREERRGERGEKGEERSDRREAFNGIKGLMTTSEIANGLTGYGFKGNGSRN